MEEHNKETAVSVDLTEMLNKIDTQNDLLKEISEELKKANKFVEDEKKFKEEHKDGQTTEDKILISLDKLLEVQETAKATYEEKLQNIASIFETGNTKNEQSFDKLLEIQEEGRTIQKEQNDLLISYAIYLIPIALFLYFFYKFLKQFI